MNLNPSPVETWQIIKNNYRMFGFRATMRNAMLYMFSNAPEDQFDIKWGTYTSNHIGFTDLGFTPEQMEAGRAYSATPSKLVSSILNDLKFNFSDFSYVDLGSGLGRTLMLASLYEFKKVEGVELSEVLVSICNKNISIFSEKASVKSPINVKNEDVLQYQFPTGKTLVFMYDPFKPMLLAECLKKIYRHCQSSPENEVYIVYVRSFHALPTFNELDFMKVIKHVQVISLDYSWSLYKVCCS